MTGAFLSVQAVAGHVGPAAIATMGGPPPEAVAITAIVFGAFAMIGVPLARAFARRIESGRSAPAHQAADASERLERIERAVEAIALEVERISEGQRFVTKLLAERDRGVISAGRSDK